MTNLLKNIVDIEDKHLTNFIVLVFIFIAAFRMMFAGMDVSLPFNTTWHIQNVDVNSLLPMALSLLNLGHYRSVRSQNNNNQSNGDNSNG